MAQLILCPAGIFKIRIASSSPALALMAFLALSTQPRAAEGIPNLDMKRTCTVDLTAPNSIPDPNCLSQENQAKQNLQAIWSKTKPQVKTTCVGTDADSPVKSYVDILTCVQMFNDE